MTTKPYRVTYHSLDDTWCRYFKTYDDAVRYMQQKATYGYRTYLTHVPDI